MLDILRLDITKDLLRKMAKEERCLFLALGHASNQVNALWKLVVILTNGDADDPVKQRLEGDAGLRQVYHRRHVGSLAPGRRSFPEKTARPGISAASRSAGGGCAGAAKEALRQIRNNYAFHHPGIDDIDAAFEKAAAEIETWPIGPPMRYPNQT
jgi:hypothetical protein